MCSGKNNVQEEGIERQGRIIEVAIFIFIQSICWYIQLLTVTLLLQGYLWMGRCRASMHVSRKTRLASCGVEAWGIHPTYNHVIRRQARGCCGDRRSNAKPWMGASLAPWFDDSLLFLHPPISLILGAFVSFSKTLHSRPMAFHYIMFILWRKQTTNQKTKPLIKYGTCVVHSRLAKPKRLTPLFLHLVIWIIFRFEIIQLEIKICYWILVFLRSTFPWLSEV